MTIDDELFGRVTTGPQQAVLDRFNGSFSVDAFSGMSSMKAIASDTSAMSSMKAFISDTSAMSSMKAFISDTSAMSSMKAFISDTSAMSSMKAFISDTSVASSMKTIASETSVASAMKTIASDTSVASAMKTIASDTSVASAMKTIASETSGMSAMKTIASDTSAMSAMKAFISDTSVASAMKTIASETSAMSAMKAIASDMSVMNAFAGEASTAALYASSALQDRVKQLSSAVSTTMDLGRVAAVWQPDLASSALQSAVRAWQPDLSAPFFTKAFSSLHFEVPDVWKDFGRQLQGDARSWLDIRAIREAAAVRLPALRREMFYRVIRFRQRTVAWLGVAHAATRIRSEHNLREAVLRALAAKRAEIAYGRAQLARREVGCMPPGQLVAARPHLTRGPNSCKSIRTHRLAGLLRT